MERKRGFTHKAVSWDGIYDIIAIGTATGAIFSILIVDKFGLSAIIISRHKVQ